MLRFLIGLVVGFLIAAIVLPENVRLRDEVADAWVATRVFVAELLSDVDEAAERAMEATREVTRDAAEGDQPPGMDAGETTPEPAAPDVIPPQTPEPAPAQ
jgi:hypothetical protein